MAEQTNKETVSRMLTGKISQCSVGRKDKFGGHSLLIKGAYEDTREPFEGFVSTKGNVNVFESGKPDPIEAATIDGKTFNGRIQISEVIYNDSPDKTWRFLNAVSVEGELEDDPFTPQEPTNPFIDNPLT